MNEPFPPDRAHPDLNAIIRAIIADAAAKVYLLGASCADAALRMSVMEMLKQIKEPHEVRYIISFAAKLIGDEDDDDDDDDDPDDDCPRGSGPGGRRFVRG